MFGWVTRSHLALRRNGMNGERGDTGWLGQWDKRAPLGCFCFWIKVKTASFRWCNGYSSTIKEGGDKNLIRSWDFCCIVWSCCNHDFSWVKRFKHVWLKSKQEFWAPLFGALSSRTQLSFCLELNQYFEVDWFCGLCSFSSTLYCPPVVRYRATI